MRKTTDAALDIVESDITGALSGLDRDAQGICPAHPHIVLCQKLTLRLLWALYRRAENGNGKPTNLTPLTWLVSIGLPTPILIFLFVVGMRLKWW